MKKKVKGATDNTVNARMAAMASRKKEQGLVKISISEWVPIDIVNECRKSAKKAAQRAIEREIKKIG